MRKIIVIGGGAGGILAAGRAAESGAKVVLLEKNSRLGRKILITGKGRCNVTSASGRDAFVSAFGENGKFLYGAYSRFSSSDLVDLLARLSVPTKIERGNRVFPASDSAEEVVTAFERWLRELKVDIRTGTAAKGLDVKSDAEGEAGSQVAGVKVFGGTMSADAVILATGGITYPATGSTGDGYRIAAEAGHTVITPTPSLSALEVKEPWIGQLQGLSLRNVSASLYAGGKRIARETGEMLFTHFGVSGPIILTLSKTYAGLREKGGVKISINLKPAVSPEELDARLVTEFKGSRQLKNYLPELLPRTLIPVFLQLSRVPGESPLSSITAPQRKKMLSLLQDIELTVTRARTADEAIVTAGGVAVGEIDPRTMESRLVRGLYFCGEVIDIDAVTGGYNLQAAFSTGWTAGESASRDPG